MVRCYAVLIVHVKGLTSKLRFFLPGCARTRWKTSHTYDPLGGFTGWAGWIQKRRRKTRGQEKGEKRGQWQGIQGDRREDTETKGKEEIGKKRDRREVIMPPLKFSCRAQLGHYNF